MVLIILIILCIAGIDSHRLILNVYKLLSKDKGEMICLKNCLRIAIR